MLSGLTSVVSGDGGAVGGAVVVDKQVHRYGSSLGLVLFFFAPPQFSRVYS